MIGRLWRWVSAPTTRYALGTLIAAGAVAGIGGWLAFETVIEETSSDTFCATCHEIRDFATAEFVGTVHHTNPTGVTATCADCHVPREFIPKMWRKARALNELYQHFVVGKLDKPEKYEAHRMEMAMFTWADMNATDSRECRACHDTGQWNLELQSEEARKYHSSSLSRSKTCIDCHKGLAHRLPAGITEDHQLDGIDL